jgi:hypothetical protein
VSTKQENAPTAPAAGKQPEWQVWAHMVAPRCRRVLLQRVPWDPCPPDDPGAPWRFDDVPRGLALGRTPDGHRIIASDALIDIIVRDPDGRERVVQPADPDLPLLLGGRALYEYRERALDVGDGDVEELQHPHRDVSLKYWIWYPYPF